MIFKFKIRFSLRWICFFVYMKYFFLFTWNLFVWFVTMSLSNWNIYDTKTLSIEIKYIKVSSYPGLGPQNPMHLIFICCHAGPLDYEDSCKENNFLIFSRVLFLYENETYFIFIWNEKYENIKNIYRNSALLHVMVIVGRWA